MQVLFTGALVGQAIPLLLSPILTRLYDPTAFGALALLTALVSVLQCVSTGRYHQAIVIPRDDQEGILIAKLALAVAVAVSATVTALLIVMKFVALEESPLGVLGWWVLAAPVGGLLGAIADVGVAYNVRNDRAGTVAAATGIRAAGAGLAQIILSWEPGQKEGLISGNFVGLALGNQALFRALRTRFVAEKLTWNKARVIASRYRRFPLFDTWGTLANIASYSLLVIGVAALYSADTAGQYSLAYRTLTLPLAILGTAVAQLLMKEFALRLDGPSLTRSFDRATLLLATVSLPAFVLAYFLLEPLFAIIFGDEWRAAGAFAAAMAPLNAVRLVVSPLSVVYTVAERQLGLMFIQFGFLAATVLALIVGHAREFDALEVIYLHTAFAIPVYLTAGVTARLVARSRTTLSRAKPQSANGG